MRDDIEWRAPHNKQPVKGSSMKDLRRRRQRRWLRQMLRFGVLRWE